jgi:hypothetical protein
VHEFRACVEPGVRQVRSHRAGPGVRADARIGSSMFALSIENHLLRGQLWVVVMVGISLLGIAATRRVGRGVTLPTRP